MSNTNTVTDLDVRIQGQSIRPLWLLKQCYYVYLVGPQLYSIGCELRRWGLQLAERGGKNAKKRAVVGVARKRTVLLHHLWKTGEIYDPFYLSVGSAQEPTLASVRT